MMIKQTNFSKNLTKKDLIRILEKIDSERTRQSFKEYSFKEEDLILPQAAELPCVLGTAHLPRGYTPVTVEK
jgi:hypothetical protein